MGMTFEELREKILQRGAELIAQGVSTEQLGYLMKGLEILENIRKKDAIADAIVQIGDVHSKLLEAKELLNQVLIARALTQLGKPAIRLWGGIQSYWDSVLPYCPPTGNNTVLFTYSNLSAVKEEFVDKTTVTLEIAPKNHFHVATQVSALCDCWPYSWALYLLKNSTDEEQKVEITGQLSSRSNGINGAYIVANGNLIFQYTSNGVPNINLTGDNALTIPPKSGLLIFVQNAGYYQDDNYNTYTYRLIHRLDFKLPEGVDWDYEAYKQLLGG